MQHIAKIAENLAVLKLLNLEFNEIEKSTIRGNSSFRNYFL